MRIEDLVGHYLGHVTGLVGKLTFPLQLWSGSQARRLRGDATARGQTQQTAGGVTDTCRLVRGAWTQPKRAPCGSREGFVVAETTVDVSVNFLLIFHGTGVRECVVRFRDWRWFGTRGKGGR